MTWCNSGNLLHTLESHQPDPEAGGELGLVLHRAKCWLRDVWSGRLICTIRGSLEENKSSVVVVRYSPAWWSWSSSLGWGTWWRGGWSLFWYMLSKSEAWVHLLSVCLLLCWMLLPPLSLGSQGAPRSDEIGNPSGVCRLQQYTSI